MKKFLFAGLIAATQAQSADTRTEDVITDFTAEEHGFSVTTQSRNDGKYEVEVVYTTDGDGDVSCISMKHTLGLKASTSDINKDAEADVWSGGCDDIGDSNALGSFVIATDPVDTPIPFLNINGEGDNFKSKFCFEVQNPTWSEETKYYGGLTVGITLATKYQHTTKSGTCAHSDNNLALDATFVDGEVKNTWNFGLTETMALTSNEDANVGITPVDLVDTVIDKTTDAVVQISRTWTVAKTNVKSEKYIVDTGATLKTYKATMNMTPKTYNAEYTGTLDKEMNIPCTYVQKDGDFVDGKVEILCEKDANDKFVLPFDHAKLQYFGASEECPSSLCTGYVEIAGLDWKGSGIQSFTNTKHQCEIYTFEDKGGSYEFGSQRDKLSNIYRLETGTDKCTLDEVREFTKPAGVTGCDTVPTWTVGNNIINYTRTLYDECDLDKPIGDYTQDGTTIKIGDKTSIKYWNPYSSFGFTNTTDSFTNGVIDSTTGTINMEFKHGNAGTSIPVGGDGSSRLCGAKAASDGVSNGNFDITVPSAIKAAASVLMKLGIDVSVPIDVTFLKEYGYGTGTDTIADGSKVKARCAETTVTLSIDCEFTDEIERATQVDDGVKKPISTAVDFTVSKAVPQFTVTHVYADAEDEIAGSTDYSTTSVINVKTSADDAETTKTVNAKHGTDAITRTTLNTDRGQLVSVKHVFNCFDDTGAVREYASNFYLPCAVTQPVKHTTTSHVRYTDEELTVTAELTKKKMKEFTDYASKTEPVLFTTVFFTSAAIRNDLKISAKQFKPGFEVTETTDTNTDLTFVTSGCKSATDEYQWGYRCDLHITGDLTNRVTGDDLPVGLTFDVRYGSHNEAECATHTQEPAPKQVPGDLPTDTLTIEAEGDKFRGKIDFSVDGETTTYEQETILVQVLDESITVMVNPEINAFTVIKLIIAKDTTIDCSGLDSNQFLITNSNFENEEDPWSNFYTQVDNKLSAKGSTTFKLQLTNKNDFQQKDVGGEVALYSVEIGQCNGETRKINIRYEQDFAASTPYYKINLPDNTGTDYEDFTKLNSTDVVLGTEHYKRWNQVELSFQHFTDDDTTVEPKEFKFVADDQVEGGLCVSEHFKADDSTAIADQTNPAVMSFTKNETCVNKGTIAVTFGKLCYRFEVACRRHATVTEIGDVSVTLDYRFDFAANSLVKNEAVSTANFGGTCASDGTVASKKDDQGVVVAGCDYSAALSGLKAVTSIFAKCGATDATDKNQNVYTMDFVQQIVAQSTGSKFCSAKPLKLTVVHSGNSTAYMAIKNDAGFNFEFDLLNFGYEKCSMENGEPGHKILFGIKDNTYDSTNAQNTIISDATIEINNGGDKTMTLVNTDGLHEYSGACINYCRAQSDVDFKFTAERSSAGQVFYADIDGKLEIIGNPCELAKQQNLDALLQVANGESESKCEDVTDEASWVSDSTNPVQVGVDELGCFRLSRTTGAIGNLDVTSHILSEYNSTHYVPFTDQSVYVTHEPVGELTAETAHYFTMHNLLNLEGKSLSLQVFWTYVGLGSRRLRHETYFLGSANPHASVGMKILPASVQVAEQLETAGMSSDIAASETPDAAATSDESEPLATEATAATTSVGTWVGVGVGFGGLVALMVVVVQSARGKLFVATKLGGSDDEYRGYKRVDNVRFSSNIAF
jgi:hypothetical protein